MSNNQKAILMLHELMHIPAIGERLIDHNVKDFINILRMDVDWSLPGKEVIDILND
jgi:predicted metallopeptidase